MSRINEYLSQILSARYGKDVRQSIHDGIKEIDSVARTAQNSATANAQTASAKASEALTASQEAVQKAQEALEAAEQAKVYAENAEAVTGVNIATQDRAGLVKGGDNHIAEDGTLELIKETTETTLPNSRKGRILIDEIGGVTEQDSTTGNNVLGTTIATTTKSGVTCVANGDGTYTLNGTASDTADFSLQDFSVDKMPYNIKMFQLGGSHNGDVSFSAVDNTWGNQQIVSINGTSAMLRTYNVYNHWRIHVTSGTVCNNLVVGLMVADDVSVWEKYTGGQPAPNPSYPMEIKKSVVKGVKTHGKNLLRNTNSIYTIAGVTWTKNSDGSINVVGTSTSNNCDYYVRGSYHNRENILPIESGTFIVSGTESSAIRLYVIKNSTVLTQSEMGEDCEFTVAEGGINAILLRVPNGITVNTTIYPMIREADVADATYEPYTESSYTFSQPIELYGMNGVQDVITPQNINRKFGVAVFDGSDDEGLVFDAGVNRIYTTIFQNKIKRPTNDMETANMLCSALAVKSFPVVYGGADGICVNTNGTISMRHSTFTSLEEWKATLASKPMTVVYELATPTTEAPPIADQIGLNSLLTYDGITYVEFIYDELEPTFKGKYGTSEVGGMTLESLLTVRNNELRITALEA